MLLLPRKKRGTLKTGIVKPSIDNGSKVGNYNQTEHFYADSYLFKKLLLLSSFVESAMLRIFYISFRIYARLVLLLHHHSHLAQTQKRINHSDRTGAKTVTEGSNLQRVTQLPRLWTNCTKPKSAKKRARKEKRRNRRRGRRRRSLVWTLEHVWKSLSTVKERS